MALIQHWKLDDNDTNTTVVATVGTNGALEGGDNTTSKTVAGPGGTITAGFDLNATDDAVDISGAGVSFADGTAFSLSVWCEWDATIGRPLGRSDGLTSRLLKLNDTTIRWDNSVGSTNSFTVPSLGTSAWCHVLVTRTAGNNSRCFVNGTESSTGTVAATGIFAPTRIGRQSSSYHDGKIAQVKIFDSDESANVTTLYAEGVDAPASGVPLRTLLGVGT